MCGVCSPLYKLLATLAAAYLLRHEPFDECEHFRKISRITVNIRRQSSCQLKQSFYCHHGMEILCVMPRAPASLHYTAAAVRGTKCTVCIERSAIVISEVAARIREGGCLLFVAAVEGLCQCVEGPLHILGWGRLRAAHAVRTAGRYASGPNGKWSACNVATVHAPQFTQKTAVNSMVQL